MSSLPPYSVVIPAYNAARTIEKTVESALAQTVPPKEIFVVNDGSSDNTLEVLGRYESPVHVVTQENAGPAAARNHGIRLATTDWIALLDSDDSWLPEKMENQLSRCDKDVGLIHCYEVDIDHDCFEGTLNFDKLWEHNFIGTSSVVVNKSVVEEVGGFLEDRAFIGTEDVNLWLRILAAGYRIETVKLPLIHYTPAEGNLSSNYERVIKAEILNAEWLGQHLNLPNEKVMAKKIALYEEYGKALFWRRNLPLARHYYGLLLKSRPSLNSFGFWLATFLPPSILNARRPATA